MTLDASTFNRFKVWTSENRDLALDALRIYLGVGLFVRGALVVAHPELLAEYSRQLGWMSSMWIAHGVASAHLVGGLLLTLGLTTRLAAAVQVPALIGAVFMIHFREGLLTTGQGLELSALVLFALLIFIVFGAGRLSLDHYIFGDAEGYHPIRARSDALLT
jgi:putative oxidoreductase